MSEYLYTAPFPEAIQRHIEAHPEDTPGQRLHREQVATMLFLFGRCGVQNATKELAMSLVAGLREYGILPRGTSGHREN